MDPEKVRKNYCDNTQKVLSEIKRGRDFNKRPNNSVLSPSAQITALCELPGVNDLVANITRLLAAGNNSLTSYEKAILELQFLYGLRISEVLNITYSDIKYNGSILVKGLKGSNDRIVVPVKFMVYWINFKKHKLVISKSFNRFYFYRLYKKKGVYDSLFSKSNKSVTHIMRYNYIIQLIKTGENIEQIQQLIGHKSINSTIYYVNSLKAIKRS